MPFGPVLLHFEEIHMDHEFQRAAQAREPQESRDGTRLILEHILEQYDPHVRVSDLYDEDSTFADALGAYIGPDGL